MKVTEVVKSLRERAGLSMTDAASAAGWKGGSSWQRYEDAELFTKRYLPVEVAERMVKALAGRGSPQISPEEVMALTAPRALSYVGSATAVFKTSRIVGTVEAGVWREAVELPPEEQEVFPVPTLPGYEGAEVFGLWVRGPSMNKVYPDGSIAYFIRVPDIEPVQGDIVVVAARKGDLYETTLKELGVDKKGRRALWPRSNDPRFHNPIIIDEVGAESVEVIGVAIGKFEPIRNGQRGKRR